MTASIALGRGVRYAWNTLLEGGNVRMAQITLRDTLTKNGMDRDRSETFGFAVGFDTSAVHGSNLA